MVLMSWAVDHAHLIGGLAGGCVSSVLCHPLDLLKIRYSANDGDAHRPRYRSYWHAARSIVKAYGWRGLYQGLTPNVLGAALSWGLFFDFFGRLKTARTEHDLTLGGESVDDFAIGMLAGGAVMVLVNPVWVVKTRLCLQYEDVAIGSGRRRYTSTVDCARRILREEGYAGFYRGIVAGLLGTVHGALQFLLYNRMKTWLSGEDAAKKTLTPIHIIGCSALSKIAATVATYPYQVVRTRMQDHTAAAHSNRSVLTTVRTTLRNEGIGGLYKGMIAATVRQLPAATVTFVTYEYVFRVLKN